MATKRKRCPYEVVGVEKSAKPETIKKAFRARARRVHPDVAGEAATPAFQELQRSYALLMDRDRRADYDATGNQEEPQHSRKHELVLDAFRKVLRAHLEGKTLDFSRSMRLDLLAAKRGQQDALAVATVRLRKAEELRAKVKFRGEGFDIVAEELEHGIDELSRFIKQAQGAVVDLEGALEIVEAYDFPTGVSFGTTIGDMHFPHGNSFFFNGSQL